MIISAYLEIGFATPPGPSCDKHVALINCPLFHILVCILGDGDNDATGALDTCFNRAS